MKLTNELSRMHEEMIQHITEENNQEMAISIAEKSAAAKAAEALLSDRSAMEALGVNVTKLDALDREEAEISKGELEASIAKMDALSQEPLMIDDGFDIESALLPPDTFRLEPNWSGVFTDNDQQDGLIDASSITTQAIVTGTGCKNLWNQARGGGWGCTGGVGSITSYANFGFWFKPPTTKFYSVQPLFKLRGYYIAKANDGPFTCKYTKVVISLQTDCYQFNWKGRNSIDVLNVNSQNINESKRFDINRHTYNSYLLAGGDWAFIRARIKLHARAQGRGSFAKNDFSTGSANYLCVPHVHVH